MVRWYLFLEKKPGSDIGHNPVAQAAMFGYFLLSVFMILTGFALFGEHSQYAIFAPFRYVVEFSTGPAATPSIFTAGTDWACG